MGKSKKTIILENRLHDTVIKQGTFGAPEVTIGWFGNERVDFLTYDTKGVFRCYEIKVSVADFHSKNHNSFIGNYNYYVMPNELYEKVAGEIPDGIGVLCGYESQNEPFVHNGKTYWKPLECVKKPKKMELSADRELLLGCLLRCLCRDAEKYYTLEDNLKHIEELKADSKRLDQQSRKERLYAEKKYGRLIIDLHEIYGREWLNNFYDQCCAKYDKQNLKTGVTSGFSYLISKSEMKALLLDYYSKEVDNGEFNGCILVEENESITVILTGNKFKILSREKLKYILAKIYGTEIEELVLPSRFINKYIIVFRYEY